jgi:hypothetical protein
MRGAMIMRVPLSLSILSAPSSAKVLYKIFATKYKIISIIALKTSV